MYKAVLFDFDLTLVNSADPIIDCYLYVLEKYGYPLPERTEVFNLIGLPLIDTIDILANGGKPCRDREQMRDDYVKYANKIMSKGSHFYKGVPEMLESLHKRGILTAVISSKLRFRIEETFEMQLGKTPVDLIIGLDDVLQPKPNPEGILKGIERLGIGRYEALYVGDNFIDSQTALNAGVDFCGVRTGSTGRGKFGENPYVGICDNASLVEKLI